MLQNADTTNELSVSSMMDSTVDLINIAQHAGLCSDDRLSSSLFAKSHLDKPT